MDLTKIKEKQASQRVEPEVEEVNWEWPDIYYSTTDADKRKEYLEKAIRLGLEPKENEIRMKMWNQRYGTQKGVDQMLAIWINLLYFANIVKSDRKARWRKREIKDIFNGLQVEVLKEYGEEAKELVYLEFYHLADFYIDICLNDKKYGSIMFGLGTMSKEKLMAKIAKEIYTIAYLVPPVISGTPEYELLRKAVVDCFTIKLPAYEKVLLYMIENGGDEPADN